MIKDNLLDDAAWYDELMQNDVYKDIIKRVGEAAKELDYIGENLTAENIEHISDEYFKAIYKAICKALTYDE